MTTKTELEKALKAAERKIKRLERELGAERAKNAGPLPASPFVDGHVTPLPENVFPWEGQS